MIVKTKAKNGMSIVTVKGKLTCSSVDPEKEARSWVEKNVHKINGQKNIFILGAGSGHHIKELARAYPESNIYVIERHQDLVEYCESEHGLDLANVKFLKCDSADQLKKNAQVVRVIKGRYAVLLFYPACSSDISYYHEIESILLGRVEEGLSFLLAQRDDLKLIDRTKKIKVASQELISIKSIIEMANQNENENELIILKTLRELVI